MTQIGEYYGITCLAYKWVYLELSVIVDSATWAKRSSQDFNPRPLFTNIRTPNQTIKSTLHLNSNVFKEPYKMYPISYPTKIYTYILNSDQTKIRNLHSDVFLYLRRKIWWKTLSQPHEKPLDLQALAYYTIIITIHIILLLLIAMYRINVNLFLTTGQMSKNVVPKKFHIAINWDRKKLIKNSFFLLSIYLWSRFY